jgi:flagellar biosynthesis protein FlhB
MSDAGDRDSRTEEPTEKKLADAAERGESALSREVPILASLTAIFLTLLVVAPQRWNPLVATLVRFIDDPAGWRLERSEDVLALVGQLALAAANFLWPIAALLAGLGLTASFAQNAPRFIPARILPKLSRLSPREGFARVFGFRGAIEFFKSIAKIATVLTVVAIVLSQERALILTAMFADVADLPERIVRLSAYVIAAVMLATLVLASADFIWSRLLFRRDQRMSREEIKEEQRQAEGDPMIKARLRSIRLDRSRKRMLTAVPRATMVIVNPTHYSVALRYVRAEGGAPMVLAKGVDLVALKIREIAKESGIPMVEDRLLARSLYEAAQIDTPIPPDFYRAVAEIVHLIQERKGAWTIDRNRMSQ